MKPSREAFDTPTSPLPTAVIDLSANVTSWNRRAEAIFQWEASEARGRELTFLFCGDDQVADGVIARLQGAEPVEGLGVRACAKDGSSVPLKVWADPVFAETQFNG